MKPTKKANWHIETKRFFTQLHSLYYFSDDEARVVQATCQNLDSFWKASEELDRDGLTFKLGDNIRAHPAVAIAKSSWAGFLSGCKLLGVCQPHDEKAEPGRPRGSWT